MASIQPKTLIILLITILTRETTCVIKKCCQPNQSLQYNIKNVLECLPNNSTNQQFHFPKHLDGTPMLSDKELAGHSLQFGVPQCSRNSKDTLHLHKRKKAMDFTFQLEGGEIMLKSLKWDSLHNEDMEHAQLFPPKTYCVDSTVDGDYIALLCPCEVMKCVRKCCRNWHGINETSGSCASTRNLFGDNWPEWFPDIRKAEEEEATNYYRLVHKYPDCSGVPVYWMTENKENLNPDSLFLLANGSLQTENKLNLFPVDEYCADYSTDINKTIVIYCYHEDQEQRYLLLMTSFLYLINAIALLVTVVLTLVIPEMRASLHNKMALAHNVMLTIGFTTTGVAQWHANTLESETCIVISYIIQYSMTASFFWLNAMCIDITIVFSQGYKQVQPHLQGTSKLIYYSLYAWGATSLITILMAAVDFTTIIPSLEPGFGVTKCFFSNDTAQWVFLYGPMGVLFTANLVMFLFTIIKISQRMKRQTTILKTANSAMSDVANMQTLTVFLKLFGLMGISWISEVISFALKSFGPCWIPVDILNLSRGFFIFFIFCCTPTVMQKLRATICRCRYQDGADIDTVQKAVK